MKRTPRNLFAAGGILVLFLLLGTYVVRWLGLTGTQLWVLRTALWALGAAAALLLFLYLRGRDRARPEQPDDEIDASFQAARRRLSGARSTRINRRPLVLVAGLPGSAKTTTVVRSGLEPELLAGEVFRGSDIVPTGAVNIWYASDTVWVEAGGPLLADEARWRRMVRQLRPARAAAVFARGTQAPRSVMVCVPSDEFLKPGAGDALASHAQQLRARLTEAADQLGVRLPVYVVFTRADRIPYFADYVRSMTTDEVQEVLGATLRTASSESGTYAEAEGARIGQAFSRMLDALSQRRLQLLPRETTEEVRAGVYEFPRELRKLESAATRFLIDLCRPSQLGTSPFLRGFYFTGVRPVVVADQAVPAATVQRAADATAVFDARALVAAAQAPTAAGSRRIPQWTFLPRLPRLITGDQVARAITGGGVRVDLMRRVLAATATGALLLLAVGLTVSHAGNRALIRDAGHAVQSAGAVPLLSSHPTPLEDLQRLDSLRATLVQLRGWQQGRRPFRLGMGLYTGERMLPELRTLYFQRFGHAMWARTRDDLGASLTALGQPQDGRGDYATGYDALKAYLITTSHGQHSTPEFLSPVLLGYWRGGSEPDARSLALAERQFDFLAAELRLGNPFGETADPARVEHARSYLSRFADADQFYQSLLAGAASHGVAPIQFHRRYPGSEVAVRSDAVIPAAFTEEGWQFVQASLSDIDQLFARDAWVLGDRVVAPGDRQRLGQELRARYVADYISAWTGFLNTASVQPFQDVGDAARKLGRLSDNQSPLLQLLALVSRNTNVDTTEVANAFQPVHTVMPPDITDRFISDGNQGYVQGLVMLHSAMERAAAARGAERTAALAEASGTVDQLRTQVRQGAQAFSIDGPAQPVGMAVQRLMQAPLESAERLARTGPVAELNEQGASFCSAFGTVVAKYPFALRGTSEASMEEVAAIFQPNASLLSAFETEALAGLVIPQGTGYGPVPGASVRASPAFLQFFGRSKQVSRGLFGPDGSGPEFAFTLRPQATEQLAEVIVTVDGQRQEVSRTMQASRTFVWNGARAGDARVEARIGGNVVTLFAQSGPWSLFRLFHQGRWEQVRPNFYVVTWTFAQPRVTLSAEVSFDRGVAVLDPAFFSGLTCVSRIAN